MIPSGHWKDQKKPDAPRPEAPADIASNAQLAAPNARPNLQSCQFCRKRKIKCDKLEGGCSQCSRVQTECIYPASQRKGRPRKAGGKQSTPAPTPREAQLMKKISKLEHVIQNLTCKVGPGGIHEEAGSLDHLGKLGSLVIGKPYVNDAFWDGQLENVLEDSDDESNDEDEDETSFSATSHPREIYPASFLFGADQVTTNLTPLHPPASQIPVYWKLYLENCEILLRLWHAPTTGNAIEEAQADLSSLSTSNELVMFSIYFATTTAMSSDEVFATFGADRTILLARYETAVKKALVNAGFLNTQDLKVLQAFVLYLVCVRHTDAAVVWTMTGLAIRIARGMGVDRDGELFKLSPLDVELRRRLWHQILLLDLRASEARGCIPCSVPYDTKLPVNINDSDIGPETRTYPEPRVGISDMTGALLRFEVCETARRLRKSDPLATKDKLVEDFRHHLETKYLQYCSTADPLQRLCLNLSRLVTKRMVLMLFKKEKDLPKATRERLFFTSIDIIDLSNQLRGDAFAGRFNWLVRTYMQWHALAFILSELPAQPRTSGTERAWKIIEEIGPKWEVPEDRPGKVLYQSIRKLLAKAQAHRASQCVPALVQASQMEDIKPLQAEPIFVAQGSFNPALLGHTFHAAPNFTSMPNQAPRQYYVPQHLPMDDIGQQQEQVLPWYFDPNVQPLQDQDLVFNNEYWTGWDSVRDHSMHGGPL